MTDENPKSTKEQLQEIPEFLKAKVKSICRKKILYKRVPILNWLPTYNKDDAIGDLVAGFTVGLTVIPQALAYAGIAKLPAAHGLYGSFLGSFIYIFLGSCKDIPMGEFVMKIRLIKFNSCCSRPNGYCVTLDLPDCSRQLAESSAAQLPHRHR